jgi:hypothetical protein
MSGTVAANITALITLQAQANASAQNLIGFECQSVLIYFHIFAAATEIKFITSISIKTFHSRLGCKNILFYFLQTNA